MLPLLERHPAKVFRSLNFDQHAKTFLVGIAILFRLNESIPDFLIDRSGFMNRGDSVKTGDAAFWQNAVFAQLRLPEENGNLCAILKSSPR